MADDEPLALRGMVRLLDNVEDVEVVGTATTGQSALEIIRAASPDLVLLDIQMPGTSGLEVAAALAAGSPTDIIFVTAFDTHAIEAFALDAVDYLLKPVQPDRLHQSLQRARRRLASTREPVSTATEDEPPCLHVPQKGGEIDVPQSEIVWIEAARDYCLIHTDQRSFIIRTTMADLATQLIPRIMRVHRSAYVCLDKVERFEVDEKGSATLVLGDRLHVAVGPSYTKAVRAALTAH
ncbi:LytR/AlgR family response regulator transcription factor [Sphingomonas guangdongensis]|uniref:LytR/AlgR family response regulator transcription factor n=1 Tax=Sphingomonas guangdongensis TaxID=1141890 RepID=UPI001181BAEE|nr:LytTR family DNA-binding domain-containing protein [Sphingomonas guangdongensis]